MSSTEDPDARKAMAIKRTERIAEAVALSAAAILGVVVISLSLFGENTDRVQPQRANSPTTAVRSDVERRCAGLSGIDGRGNLDPKRAPELHLEVVPVEPGGPGTVLGCVPTALSFPALDGGRAQRVLANLTDTTSLLTPVPVYSPSDLRTIIGYNMPSGTYLPIASAIASGRLPTSLVASPPPSNLFDFDR